MKTQVGFIGAGRISKIFLEAWEKAGLTNISFTIFDIDESKMSTLAERYPTVTKANSISELASDCSVVFLAIHPPAFKDVMPELKKCKTKPELIISLSPKISIRQIVEMAGYDHIVRSIPNAPSVIGKGFNVYAPAPNLANHLLEKVEHLFKPLGKLVRVDEELLEAYATITGMGPTYLWFLFEHLKSLAQKIGIPEQDAKNAVNEMIAGSADTLLKSSLSFEEVLDLIPSYPMKARENEITKVYSEVIESLYSKLKI
ncbi:MAG: NAD(P)-binding domain-containing protein [Tenuifilum sp.]|uniref:pyrroline-5-carboxylate reductase family protein n=1 Tax=Tenuifilum sp. TaxID=2760880 RepID=UPI003098349B